MARKGWASLGLSRSVWAGRGTAWCGMAAAESPGIYSVSMAVALHWAETHTSATVREIAKRVGLRSSQTTHRWLERAVSAGLIEKRDDHYWPRETCICPSCGAAHVSERASA